MPGRSGGGRNLPFDVLSGDAHTRLSRLESDPLLDNGEKEGAVSSRRRRKAKRKRRPLVAPERAASEDPSHMVEPANEKPTEFETFHLVNGNCVRFSEKISVVEKLWENAVVKADHEDSSPISCVSFAELMQTDAIGCVGLEQREEVMSARDGSDGEQCPAKSNKDVPALTKQESCNSNGSMEDGSNFKKEASFMEKLPFKYFMGEIYGGSSLRGTVSAGNAKKRQRVYNTMFHVPWRCERVILAGFFVCLDSFLSLLTIMPARIAMAIWRVLNTRRLWRPSAAELSDFGCFIVLAFGVASLQLADISLIYHFIRGQGTIKLYVVYNVLEIFDKLFQSFGEDVLQVLFDSAEGLSTCPPDNLTFELIRFIFDEVIAVIAFGVHSFVLLAQAITLATCIIAHNNALLALLVSNNFAEIKSNVFKKISKDNLHHLVYYDIVERFHITAFILFVLAQNILEAEGPWFESFLCNVLMVYMCEVFVDAIKHSFLAKFNEIKPFAYSEFLEDLSKQTLNEKPDDRRKDLTFIPLAPACVVIRVLTPVYANLLPSGPLHRRLLWIFVWSNLTYFILLIWKILVGTSLRRLAAWYIKLRRDRKHHAN